MEYEDIQTETKLEDYASMVMEMRNEEVGMKYVKDGESSWTQVVIRRRRKSVRSEDVDNRRNANVSLNLIEGRSLLRYRKVNGIPGLHIC